MTGFILDDFLPYQLAVLSERVSREFSALYRERFGISIPEWRVVAHLSQSGPVSVREISARAAMDKSKTSRAAARLEAAGYVTKRADPGDGRLIALELTEAGQAMVEEIREVLAKKATDLDVEFRIEVPPDVGTFPGDDKAIRAMLLNLLENSLDACRMDKDKGDHWIRLDVRREAPWLLIEVEDNGMGMDQETREKIFSLFFSSKGIKGTGLGLFISNKIVDKHGGTIEVDSELGRGTRFMVRLPLDAKPSIQPEDEN